VRLEVAQYKLNEATIAARVWSDDRDTSTGCTPFFGDIHPPDWSPNTKQYVSRFGDS